LVTQTSYDYILTGGGAAGLLLAFRMSQDKYFDDKQILLIDASAKDQNDRTWCFWSKEETIIEDVISKRWNKVLFKSPWLTASEHTQPYTYNKVRSIDFYNHVHAILSAKSNFTQLQEKVIDIYEDNENARVKTTASTYVGKQVFNSVLFDQGYKNDQKYPLINQHFVGWTVKTDGDFFDPDQATFMDFDIPQKGNTRFMYVLPTTKNEALLEYTLFSKDMLEREAYTDGIKEYLKNLGVTNFEVVEEESGCIPMTCYPFWINNSTHINHIGIAGGWAKASTGYTFRNAMLKTNEIVHQLKKGSRIKTKSKTRFWLYDLLLLDILNNNNAVGSKLFSAMFQNNSLQDIFAFLDEEAHNWSDLKTLWNMPKAIFTKALVNRIIGRY